MVLRFGTLLEPIRLLLKSLRLSRNTTVAAMTKLEMILLGIVFLFTIALIVFMIEYITVINAIYYKISQVRDYTLLQK